MAGKKGQKITKKHEDSPRFAEYYKKQNPEWTIEQCEEKAKWFKKSCNYQCIEYYEKNYPNLSHEEHLELKKKLQLQKKQNKDTNIEYWKERYPEKSIEELEQLRSKAAKIKNKQNLEYWITKYPEKDLEEVKKLHQEYYQSWLSHQEGWGKGDKNCNSKKNSTQERRNSMSPRNIAFYERKYPNLSHEEHLKLQKEFFEKNRLAVKKAIKPTNIEYYLNQGMSEEEAKIALKNRQTTFTYEKCIKKYGEELGKEKFIERQQNWKSSLQKAFNHCGSKYTQSAISNNMIKILCEKINIEIPKYELCLINNNIKKIKTHYFYDFYYKDKIIEFNGDYWHCNPKYWNADKINKSFKKPAKDIWEKDLDKKICAENQGYKVLIVWESEYKENKEETLKKCIDFLTND